MQLIHHTKDLRTALSAYRSEGKSIGFVPTMGNLHAGHISLVALAKQHADVVVASIFVNPLQFGPDEDLDNYPRTLEADCEQLATAGCELVFAPTVTEMYPTGAHPLTTVEVSDITQQLCGHSRPTHFVGVTTVVSKLFNLFQPDVAVFGKKDYQQLAVIRRMVAELCFPIQVLGAEIVREPSGLAMSSRNHYLSDEQRQIAPSLQQHLQLTAELLKSGDRNFDELESAASQALNQLGFRTDYWQILTPKLQLPRASDQKFVVFGAAYLGQARLIDNIEVSCTLST